MLTSPLYDIDEASAYLKIQPGTLRNWLSARRLGYVKVGRLTRISKLELDRFLAAHTVAAVEENESP
jgi:excisionase family DNA binding protein